jgi:REP element-mobilizing transposase RayT
MREYYKRNLPHVVPMGGQFFITANIVDAIPKVVLKKLVEENEKLLLAARLTNEDKNQQLIIDIHKRYFAKIDKLFDTCTTSPKWLAENDIAVLLKQKLHEFDGFYYNLQAYCIMSNHVHILLDTSIQKDTIAPNTILDETNYIRLDTIMKRIKGGISTDANKILQRTGRFWARESYDHLVRNPQEMWNIIRYILNNPVKAGLVKEWFAWQHTYIKEDLKQLL